MSRAPVVVAALIAVSLLAACRSGPDGDAAPAPAAPPEADTSPRCQPTQFAYLVGRNRSEIPADGLPPGARIIGPDDILTLEYLPNRLNIVYGENGIVTEVKCG